MSSFYFALYVIGSIVFFVMAVTYGYAGLRAAPWVPTRKRGVAHFLELAAIAPGEVVYDLGCGDGRLLAAAAKSGAKAVGYEISLLPYLMARLRGLDVRFNDFWKADFHDADVVYFFLSPKAHAKLGEKLKTNLKPGARVITYTWPIAGWTAEKILKSPNGLKTFLYRPPS